MKSPTQIRYLERLAEIYVNRVLSDYTWDELYEELFDYRIKHTLSQDDLMSELVKIDESKNKESVTV